MPAIRVVEGPEQGTEVPFSRTITIGRSRECGLRIGDEESSRRHAEIANDDDGRYTLRDLGSSNGTFANGARITEHVLSNGDRFTIGSIVFEFLDKADHETDEADIVTGELVEEEPEESAGPDRESGGDAEATREREPAAPLDADAFEEPAGAEAASDQTPPLDAAPENDSPPGYTLIDSVREDELTTRYHATELGLGRPATVELIQPELCRDAEAVLARVRIAARIECPAATHVHAAGRLGDRVYVACEPVSGQSMQRLGGKLEPDEVAEIGSQVAGALAEAHRLALVHGSLRPSRIVRTNAGHVKLLALGLPIRTTDDGGDDWETPGRLAFRAPELLDGSEPSEASDVYALGAVLYHMVGGRPPFDAPTAEAMAHSVRSGDFIALDKLQPDTPAALVDLVHRMLARHPADRPQSMGKVRDALRELARPRPAAAPPRPVVTVSRPPVEPEHRGISAATILVVILTLLLLTSVFLLGHLGGEHFIREGAGSLLTPAELGGTTPPAAP
jgi:serine/threonine-protein kinase